MFFFPFIGGIEKEDDDNIQRNTGHFNIAGRRKKFGSHTHITKMLSILGTTPIWIFLAWAAFVFLCSPILFIISVCLPEIPLMIMRRICYVPFDSM